MPAFFVLLLAAAPLFESGQVVHDLAVKQVTQSGGTQHFAGPTVFSRQRKSVTLADDFSPLIEAQLRLSPHAWLVLGWSSGGAGMMGIELLVVREGEQLTIVDRLSWLTARSLSGVFLQKTPTGWRVGLPELQPLTDFYDQTLTHGKLRVTVGPELHRVLRFDEVKPDQPLWAYHPPSDDSVAVTGKVGWVEVSEHGFQLPAK